MQSESINQTSSWMISYLPSPNVKFLEHQPKIYDWWTSPFTSAKIQSDDIEVVPTTTSTKIQKDSQKKQVIINSNKLFICSHCIRILHSNFEPARWHLRSTHKTKLFYYFSTAQRKKNIKNYDNLVRYTCIRFFLLSTPEQRKKNRRCKFINSKIDIEQNAKAHKINQRKKVMPINLCNLHSRFFCVRFFFFFWQPVVPFFVLLSEYL